MKKVNIRNTALIISILLIPTGIIIKKYSGPKAAWINNSLGGIIYVIFWCLIIYSIIPKSHFLILPVIVFLITFGIEFTQLLSPPLLESIRSTFIGRTLIGTDFVLSDFIYYFIGSLISAVIIKHLKKENSNGQ